MTMRYLMKGGYWKNSEDEVLKVAVMKYGLNQWDRISSLLARKSATQCKARWYEWLDPSIKKTEWTREEEEKLLHLTKIFPSQWRNIAPLLQRTPHQCIEHYEKLLDMAQNKKIDDENNPRILKTGEIDPIPEVRAPRPDPIDMDDDEKEMIAEAKIRIHNIKGKKAKRRAREKVIEESRKLAQTQKFRELHNAGIDFIIERKRRNRGIEYDYGSEIPLKRNPVEFLYSTENEPTPKVDENLGNININHLEGKRRDERKIKKQQEDMKKIKKLNNLDLPGKINRINKDNPLLYLRRNELIWDEPLLNDNEIELIAKNNKNLKVNNTDFLLTDYSIKDDISVKTPKKDLMTKNNSNLSSIYLKSSNLSFKDDNSLLSRTSNPYKNLLLNNNKIHDALSLNSNNIDENPIEKLKNISQPKINSNDIKLKEEDVEFKKEDLNNELWNLTEKMIKNEKERLIKLDNLNEEERSNLILNKINQEFSNDWKKKEIKINFYKFKKLKNLKTINLKNNSEIKSEYKYLKNKLQNEKYNYNKKINELQ